MKATIDDKEDVVQRTVQRMGSRPPAQEGFEWSFYTLWHDETDEGRIWEQVPRNDFVGTVVEGTGRQDWRKLRPFDLLPDLDPDTGGVARRIIMAGEHLRIGCERIAGPQPLFERAGDYQTIFFQFSGISLVETSFGRIELFPGEGLLVPAMVAHRTIGSANCRRMVFHAKDPVKVGIGPEQEVTDIRYTVHRQGDPDVADSPPQLIRPEGGRIRECLSHWADRPGEAYLFERTYDAMVGGAESGHRPAKVRPFSCFSTPPAGPGAAPVRTALLWESPTFRQRVYSNPGRQPAPHRGYDEDEYWFQFSGRIEQETEHGRYRMESGDVSMAEAGISHTSTNEPGSLRLTTYTNSPIRMVVDPSEHLRESHWDVREEIVRAWPTR